LSWITINLPFFVPIGTPLDMPPYPDLSEEILAEFGASFESVDAAVRDSPLHSVLSDEIDKRYEEDEDPGDPDPHYQVPEEWLQSGDATKVKHIENRHLRGRILKWKCQHPRVEEFRKASTTIQEQGTFKGTGFLRPGVQVEMEDGKRYLLGDVNLNGGPCDDCPAFESQGIVVRYRVLVSEEALKEE